MKALILAAPTMDLIRGPPRPGGPSLYAGAGARAAGCTPHALGPVGVEGMSLVYRAHRLAGVELEAAPSPGPPYTFRLTYTPTGRLVSLAARPAMPTLTPDALHAALRRVSPAVIVAAPVHGEIPPGLLPLARAAAPGALLALDPQGYARLHGPGWPHAIPPASYDLIHYSTDDPQPPQPPRGLALLTSGARPGTVLLDGRPIAAIPEPPRVLDDPTGAGDAFTALAACCIARGGDPGECAAWAASTVPDVLEDAHAAVEEAAGGLGG